MSTPSARRVRLRLRAGMNAAGELLVYPNPTSGLVHLKFQVARETELKIEVLNGIGQRLEIIRAGLASPGEFETELLLKEKGIYFIKVITGEQTLVRQVVRY